MNNNFFEDSANYIYAKARSSIVFSVSVALLSILLLILLVRNSPYSLNRNTIHNSLNALQYSQSQQLNFVKETREHLASYLHVPIQDVLFSDMIRKTWTDSTYNCPVPYATRTQYVNKQTKVPVPVLITQNINGWLIVFTYGSYAYQYHVNDNGDWSLCNKTDIPNNIAIDYVPTSK
jgi:hypothetical protein